MPDDAPRQLGEYSTTPPDQDDIDALHRWALDAGNHRRHPGTALQIIRVCNGVSTLRAEVVRLRLKLKRERARARKLASGRASPPDPNPYCKECGEDDPKSLSCIDTYADSKAWRCMTCGHVFQTRPRPMEE